MTLEKVKIVFKNNREYNFNHGYRYTSSMFEQLKMFIWGVPGVWYTSPPPPTKNLNISEQGE